MSRKTFLIAVILISCSSAFAAVQTVTAPDAAISPGWNYIALPAFPIFSGGNPPGYPPDVLDELVGSGTGLDNKLTRWDTNRQSMIAWDSTNDQAKADFGNLLPGDGYGVRVGPGAPSIYFSGVTGNDSIDMFINLPKAGWTVIGFPYSSPVPISDYPYYSGDPYLWENVKVTDGLTTKSLLDASQYNAHWVCSLAVWWDSVGKGFLRVGTSDDNGDSESMIAWHAYWVKSYKDDLGLIFTAPNP